MRGVGIAQASAASRSRGPGGTGRRASTDCSGARTIAPSLETYHESISLLQAASFQILVTADVEKHPPVVVPLERGTRDAHDGRPSWSLCTKLYWPELAIAPLGTLNAD